MSMIVDDDIPVYMQIPVVHILSAVKSSNLTERMNARQWVHRYVDSYNSILSFIIDNIVNTNTIPRMTVFRKDDIIVESWQHTEFLNWERLVHMLRMVCALLDDELVERFELDVKLQLETKMKSTYSSDTVRALDQIMLIILL